MDKPLAEASAHLRAEADFNRSWIDGRRGDGVTSAAAERRLFLAERCERWAAEIDRSSQKLEKGFQMNGYSVEVNTAEGQVFRCTYRQADLPIAMQAIQNHAMREGHADIILSRCEEPPPPMTIEQWIERGGSLD